MLREARLTGIVLLPVLAGCVAPLEPTAGPASVVEDLLARVRLLERGGFEVDAPVHVMLIGFPAGTAAAVQGKLGTAPIEHEYLDFARAFPPEPATLLADVGGTLPEPVIPVAHYLVHDAAPELTEAFLAFAASADVEGAEGILDANAAEDWLAGTLPAHGFPVDAATPALVVLHGGETLGDHGWRTTFPAGWLEPVRAFGERTPLLVFDVSAREDPYVTTGPFAVPVIGVTPPVATPLPPRAIEREPYNYVVDAASPELADTLALLVEDAAHFRLLQSAIYPITTKPCHAVTLILAIRATSLAERAGYGAEGLLDVEALTRAFENLVGEGRAFVDLKVLRLPLDDPVLEAVIPRSAETLDVFRWWLDENWDTYWMPHEGCEPYVSFLVSGDTTQQMGFSGIAMYGVQATHRISFSIVDDLRRIRWNHAGPGEEVVNDKPESIDAYDAVMRLYAHETGHLMGQHHPHNVIRTDDGTPTTPAFSAVWSVMSYQNRERMADFGAIDRANHMRNRAGFVIQEAMHAGLEDAPEFRDAIAHLARYEWQEAGDLLVPLLQDHHAQGCAGAC